VLDAIKFVSGMIATIASKEYIDIFEG